MSETTAPPSPSIGPRRWVWILKRIGIAIAILVVLIAAIGLWVFNTASGRDFALSQTTTRLPSGMSMRWGGAEGTLAGPLALTDVEFLYDDIRFYADYVYLDPRVAPLLKRRLLLNTLRVRGATLSLPSSEDDEPMQLPTWPDVLPKLELPFEMAAEAIDADGFKIIQAEQPIIDIQSIRGQVALLDDGLQATDIVVHSDLGRVTVNGHYFPARNYASDLSATAVFPAYVGRKRANVGLIVRGDLDRMIIAVAGRAPDPLRAALTLQGDDLAQWRLTAKTKGLDPALFVPPDTTAEATASVPLAFDLNIDGKDDTAVLSGTFSRGDLSADIQPSTLHKKDQLLTLDSLIVDLFDGRITVAGDVDFAQDDGPRFELGAHADRLRFTAAESAESDAAAELAPTTIDVDTTLKLAGTIDAWDLTGDSTLTHHRDHAELTLHIHGDSTRANIETLHVVTPTGTLNVDGNLAWSPIIDWTLHARLNGFDPGYFLPGWDGQLSGDIRSHGQALETAGYEAEVSIDQLSGQVRDRALAARGQFSIQGETGEGELQLSLGRSRIEAHGRLGDQIDARAELHAVMLDDFLPGGSGEFHGNAHLSGARDAPNIQVDISGNQLRWNAYQAQSLTLRGQLPWRAGNGELTLAAQQIDIGVAVSAFQAVASGAVENLRLNVDSTTEYGSIALAGQAKRAGENWSGALETLRIVPVRGDALNLRSTAAFHWASTQWRFDEACLVTSGQHSICARGNWPREGVAFRTDGLSLELLHPWLPKNEGRNLLLRGDLIAEGNLKPDRDGIQGRLHAASVDGGLRMGDRSRRELIRYDNFNFDLNFDAREIHAHLGVGFQGDGYIDARIDTGWDDPNPLQGDLHMYMSRLFWIELISPDLVRPRGVVRGHVDLRGTRGHPELGGQLLLEDFTGEFPSLGLSISEGQGRLDAAPDGSARIAVSAKSGEGTLNVDGPLSWYGDATPLRLDIKGENVLVSNTAELRAVANPDLEFSFAGKNTMVLRGNVSVPSADIDLERLDRGTSASSDVVVADPVDPDVNAASPLDLDLNILIGDGGTDTEARDVRISGFGLKGALNGSMHIRARPGRQMMATGVLDVVGEYKAYGQELQISRGQMTWSNNVVSDPRINLRAERRVSDVTAGIDVTGHAQAPRIQVWSTPAMSQSEALGYLILGRSLEGATGAQAQQVTAASTALSAGGGLLASQLGAKLGLDDAGVTQSRALGGSVIGVGKYLSPKLYVGYGVSMVGSGQVLILKYLLQRGFDVEVESSTVETRGSVNWRREK